MIFLPFDQSKPEFQLPRSSIKFGHSQIRLFALIPLLKMLLPLRLKSKGTGFLSYFALHSMQTDKSDILFEIVSQNNIHPSSYHEL